jgi:hypothetical protein
MKFRRTAAAAALALALALDSPAAPSRRKEILGTWTGTSTCVDRARYPACKDEVVVYEFREKSSAPDGVSLQADKIVDGKRVTMGDLDFAYDAAEGAWLSEFRNRSNHILWRFVVHGTSIEGTLVDLPEKNLIRRVAVKRP